MVLLTCVRNSIHLHRPSVKSRSPLGGLSGKQIDNIDSNNIATQQVPQRKTVRDEGVPKGRFDYGAMLGCGDHTGGGHVCVACIRDCETMGSGQGN